MFRIYDDDDSGLIVPHNLIRCSKDLEEPVTQQEVAEMVKMGDVKKQGGVDHEDFMELMRELGLWGKEKDDDN